MRARTWIVAVAVCVVVTGLFSVAGWPGAAYRHSDFFQFWAAPRLLLEGTDPYDAAAWASIYDREATAPVATPPPPGRHIYPLWSAVLMLPLGALPLDIAAAAWLVAQLAIVGVALRTLARIVGLERRDTVLLFALAAGSQPFWLLVGGGNMTGALLGLLVAALVAVRSAPAHAGRAIGLLALKPHPFGLVVPVLFTAARPADRVRIVLAAAATGVLLLLIALPFGPSWIAAWVAAVTERATTAGSSATVWTIGRAVPGDPLIAPMLAAASLAAFAAWWRWDPDRDPSTLVAGAVPISLFVAPHGWSYDHLLLLVPLAVVLGQTARLGAPRRVSFLMLTALIAGPLTWALYAVALARGGEEWSAVTPLAVFALLVAAERRAGRSPGSGLATRGGARGGGG